MSKNDIMPTHNIHDKEAEALNKIIQCAVNKHFTETEWNKIKQALYIALHNCLSHSNN